MGGVAFVWELSAMLSMLKIMLASSLALFAGYVYYVEPNASQDPVGAATRAAGRLVTTCERNQAECAYMSDVGDGIARAGRMGYGLLTGEGHLVYVTDPSEQARPSHSSLGSLLNSGANPWGGAGQTSASGSAGSSGGGFRPCTSVQLSTITRGPDGPR